MTGSVEASRELKLVTCLFVDIVGSTDAVVRLGPERMQRLLSDGFAQISGTIKAHGGVVEKFIGDAILGVFGIPVARPDDAERALRAADACVRWASAWAAAGGLDIRAGIETGDLLVDSEALETQQRMMIGQAINTAARLQAVAQPGQVVVGPGCHEATSSSARFEPLGTLDLKGLGPIEGWRFERFHEAAANPEIAFVGRDAELRVLDGLIARARSGAPALAVVTGPPGQGKSRLAREVIRRADGFRVLEARCRPDSEGGRNTPLRQLLDAEVGLATPEAVHERMKLLLGPDEAAQVATAIAHGAGVLVDDRLLAISRLEQREIIARAWERYLTRTTEATPLALLVEDVQWADPQLLRVLDYVTSRPVGALLAIATARPELPETALHQGDGRVRLELGPLDAAAAVRLASITGADGELVSASVERAAGNPLFLIELARSQAGAGRLPVNIQAAIAARLDELEADDRRLLQHASVAGERFTLRDAGVLADRDPDTVVASTARAAQLGFIVPDGSGYRFHHALVRDVVYGRLPVAERMALHARYAADGVDAGDQEARAYHWWEALKPPDAAWVWDDATRLAQLRADAYETHVVAAIIAEQHNAYEQALVFAQRAIELTDELSERAAAEAEAGRLCARQGRGDEGWAHRLRALELYDQAGVSPPASLYANMLELMAFNWGYFHDLPEDATVRGLLADGLRVARESGDDASLAMLLAEQASYTEDPSSVEEIKALLARPDAAAFADAAQRMATVSLWSGRVGDALEVFEDVLDRLVPAGAIIWNAADARVWYGVASVMGGDLERARRVTADLDDETEYRSAHTRSHYFAHRALVDLCAGDWDDLRAVDGELHALVARNADASFCLLGAGEIALAATGEILHGRPLPADLDADVARLIPDEELIHEAAVLLPKVMLRRPGALESGLRGYATGLNLADRYRVWDPIAMYPSIALTMVEDWPALAPFLVGLREAAAHGASLAAALAAAIREEQRAAQGGPAPAHAELRRLGYEGISELLRYRVPVSARPPATMPRT